jgi:hypothetical protein
MKFVFLLLNILFLSSANAENPIIDRYRSPSLPTFDFKLENSDIRYDDPEHIPSNFSSIEQVQKLMTELRYNRRSRSQCYQRAHLWSIEMRQMANAKTQKVFLFFTDRYIREFQFGWWFHVAPLVLIQNQEWVVDPYFFDRPVDLQTWTNYFMPSHPVCKVAQHYSDYENGTNSEYCFLRKLPMYYYSPVKIEERDKQNKQIDDWIDDEVIGAYQSLRRPWWKL